MAEHGQSPSMAAVGRRAGLARSSVDQYFDSPEAMLQAVVADVFPDWASQVRRRVDVAGSPGEKVWAYAEANVDLFASSEQAVAQALSRFVEPHVLRGPMKEFHAQLQIPLREALTDLGEPDVATMAETIDAIILYASRGAAHDDASCSEGDLSRERTLPQLRRLLGGYLHLES
jgi:AcrR family transcriptional regulator